MDVDPADSESVGAPQLGRTPATIACCECGAGVQANAANMCVACVRARVDITDSLPKAAALHWCKFCDRWLQPPDQWLSAPLESPQLLALCLQRLRAALSNVKLTDASFVWTEPHSKRIRVKLTVQKDVLGGVLLQQSFVVEFTVHNQMCSQCQRAEAKDFWRAVVQVRQRCEHRKTLFYLEQLILKYKMHSNCTGLKPMPAGLDLFYAKQQDARRLVDFISASLPCRHQHAQELVTHDAKNNVFDYKHTYAVEIVPICKDNIVCLPKRVARSLGNMGQLVICQRVSNLVHVIDPSTAQLGDISAQQYFREPFLALCQPRQLTQFTVIDIEHVELGTGLSAGHGHLSNKHGLGDAWVQRSSELGKSGARLYSTRTHLAHLLAPGDTALGLDLLNINVNDEVFDALKQEDIPDVILVKKVYDRTVRKRTRNWKLRRLAEQDYDTNSMQLDFDDFLEDLEEDPVSRHKVNIYKASGVPGPKESAPCDPDAITLAENEQLPRVELHEMLDDLQLDD